jgi:1-phosphofructokinase family hexose kinase
VNDPTILCISANPALDRQLRLPALFPGEVNRALRVLPLPGGKAAHVALSARALGAKAIWIGFLGGAIGDECAAELRKLDIEVVAIQTKSSTRVNVEIVEDSGRITEVLEPGAAPDAAQQAQMGRILHEGLRSNWKGALVAICGSLPTGIHPDFYASLIQAAHAAGSKVFVDTSGDALRACILARPEFVKPNRKEMELLLGKRLSDIDSFESAAKQLARDGVQSSAITLGADGLVWSERRGGPIWLARPPHLKAISTVGCGDATLAGFAWATLNGWQGEQAARFATACGAANCLAEFEGRILLADVESLIPQIDVKTL